MIIGRVDLLNEDDRAAIDDYVRYNDDVELEDIENLREMNIVWVILQYINII